MKFSVGDLITHKTNNNDIYEIVRGYAGTDAYYRLSNVKTGFTTSCSTQYADNEFVKLVKKSTITIEYETKLTSKYRY